MQKTAAAWNASNRILGRGTRGEETDTGRHKIGDGISPWSSLNYAGEEGSADGPLVQYYLDFNSTHNVNPGGFWRPMWDSTYDNDGRTLYPGSLPTDNLTAIPPGKYQIDVEVDFASPLPEDIRVGFQWNASNLDTENPQVSMSAGPVLIPASAADPLYMTGSGVVVIPEDVNTANISIKCLKADASNPNTNPYVINYAMIFLTKI